MACRVGQPTRVRRCGRWACQGPAIHGRHGFFPVTDASRFFCRGTLCLHEGSSARERRCYRPTLKPRSRLTAAAGGGWAPYWRRGRARGPARASPGCGAAGQARPEAVLTTACWTAMEAPRPAGRRCIAQSCGGQAGEFMDEALCGSVPAVSYFGTKCQPLRATPRELWVGAALAMLCSATRKATPSASAVHGCG